LANSITDNRTILADAENITDGISGSWTGSTSPVQDTDVKIQGSASIAEQMTNSERTILWNAGTTLDLTDNTIYIWANCGVVGLLLSKASGGFKVRFTGPTTTNYWDAYVGGNDNWPNAVAGGWVQFVIDLTSARATAVTNGWTGGTPPANSAIQHIGVAVTTSAMTKVSDNTWVDSIWRLPPNTPGILVQGRNGGTTPWTFADMYTQLGQGSGAFRPGPGGAWVINTPLQFGVNDTTTHAFSDTNQLVLWDNQEYAATDLYKISALGNAGGNTSVTLGVKSGTGDAATGAQGVVFRAAATGVRFAVDFDDANLNSIGLYGCTFQHAGDMQFDSTAVEVISSQIIDCTSARIDNSLQLRNAIIDANTADGVAFMTTDDISDIKFCTFEFSDGHAIEVVSGGPSTQTSKGNKFSGYGSTGTNDAAVYNNTAGALTINVTDLGDGPTYRNGTSASTTVNSAVTVTITVVDQANSPVNLAQVGVYRTSDDFEVMNQDTNASGVASTSYNFSTDTPVYIRVRKSSTGSTRYLNASTTGTITSSGLSVTITIRQDPFVP
jgi:hypothetical protein